MRKSYDYLITKIAYLIIKMEYMKRGNRPRDVCLQQDKSNIISNLNNK